jgi:hypothetical protein
VYAVNLPGGRSGAAERARWLAELALAVDQAQRIAWSLGVSEAGVAEVEGLCHRLELARIEIEALRRGASPARRVNLDPLWTSFLNFSGNPN